MFMLQKFASKIALQGRFSATGEWKLQYSILILAQDELNSVL
jgi:hypothetical protein